MTFKLFQKVIDKQIKVCIITSAHPAKDNRIFFKEAITLKENGLDVCLIAPGKKDYMDFEIQIFSIPEFTNWKGRLKNHFKIFRKVKNSDANIFHLHDPDLIILGVIIKWFLHKKVIYDAHEDLPLALSSARDYIPRFLRKLLAFLVDHIERFGAKRLSGVVAVYEHRMKKIANEKKPAVLIPNYPKLSFFPNIDYGKKNYCKMIYIGGISEARGMSIMLALMKELKQRGSNLTLDLVGPFFTKKQEEDFLNELKQDKLDNIFYYGRVPYPKIPPMLEEASIGLIPWLPTTQHKYAANPTKMFEYMAACIVSVAGDYGIFHDIFSHNIAGVLYNPYDPKQMADEVIRLTMDEERLKEGMQYARELFLKKYNWDRLESSFINFYKEIISG